MFLLFVSITCKTQIKINSSEKLRELYANIDLRNRLLSNDFNESSAASCRLILHYNKVEEKPDRRDLPLLKKLLMKRAKQKNWKNGKKKSWEPTTKKRAEGAERIAEKQQEKTIG